MTMRSLKIMAMVILGVGILSIPGNCFAEEPSNSSQTIDLSKAWFTPSLIVDTDPVCNSFLSAVRDKFESTDSLYSQLRGFERIPHQHERATVFEPQIQFVANDYNQYQIKVDERATLYAKLENLGGCGGACEKYQLLVSDQKLPLIDSRQHKPASTPGAPDWYIVKDSTGAFFALGNVDGHLQLYRIVAPEDWRLSCDVALKPDKPQESTDREVQKALQAVHNLNNRVKAMSGGAGGDCGSMATPWRWRRLIEEGLTAALYRPWALAVSRNNAWTNNYYSENSGGNYPRINNDLKLWSLGGITQYKAYEDYQTQLTDTVDVLSKFYSKQFGWPEKRSSETAWAATTNVISDGFGFYMYDPYPRKGERELREAILERKPIADIREITLESVTTDQTRQLASDSILNIALQYPEALRYLLEIGLSPNAANEFGKTPLMYAVQQNQLEAARILLAAGADPNAATIIPWDRCSYTLKTAHMTALHYATRYASMEMIKLLIKNGAVTFLQTYNERQHEYPLDWLHKYTGEDNVEEKNPHISPGEIEEISKLLQVPSDTERNGIAKNKVLLAESDYTKGNMEAAYRNLLVALAAQPENAKAISDLPVVALKAGELGPAIKAANQATKYFKEPALQAAAWFNKGLVCEQASARYIREYDGNACEADWIQPFVHALQIEVTPARIKKLKNLFDPDKEKVCLVPEPDSGDYRVRFFPIYKNGTDIIRIYIFHRADTEIDPTKVQWSIKFSGHTETTVLSAKVIKKITLDQDAVTILEGTNYGIPSINGHKCRDK